MSQLHEQPEKHGAKAPQVAVRDGDRLLCPCCGQVLMYLSEEDPEGRPSEQPSATTYPKLPGMPPSPWDIIARRQDAQKEAAWEAYCQDQQAKQDQAYARYLQSDDPGFCADYLMMPIDPEVAAYEFPAEDPPTLPSQKKTRQPCGSHSKTHRQQKLRPQDISLEEPYSHDVKRYLAWTFYHLKVQDLELQEKILVKQTKLDRLRNEQGGVHEVACYEAFLPNEDVTKVRPHVEVVEFDLLHWIERVRDNEECTPYRNTRLSSVVHQGKERGPPC